MANSAGGARALERSLGRAGRVRAQPSSPEYVLVVRPLKGGTKLSRSICKILLEEGCARTPPARPRDLSRARAPPAELAMGVPDHLYRSFRHGHGTGMHQTPRAWRRELWRGASVRI